MKFYVERAQFVVAPQDSGKSTQLRSMFLDKRLGLGGVIPTSRKIARKYHISNERKLYLRLTSPHEYGDSVEKFHAKIRAGLTGGRWSIACPFQPDAFNHMPDVVDSVKAFIACFKPERTRVVFLSPNRHGIQIDQFLPGRDLILETRATGAEVICVDARNRTANGLVLADFFDFT